MPLYVANPAQQSQNTSNPNVTVSIVWNPPDFPYPLTLGNLNYSVPFEGFPSGSITYLGITEPDMPQIEESYLRNGWLRTPVRVNGIQFIVSGFNYQRENYQIADHRDGQINEFDVFQVTLDLQSADEEKITGQIEIAQHISVTDNYITVGQLARAAKVRYKGRNFKIELPENRDKKFRMTLQDAVTNHARRFGCYVSYVNGISLVPLRGGSERGSGLIIANVKSRLTSINPRYFPAHLIMTDGTNSYKIPPSYNDTEITWGEEDEVENNPDEVEWEKIEPKIEKTYEEDEFPDEPPPNSLILRTLDSNRTHSGPFKTRTETERIDGTPEKTDTYIWGFEYTAEEIANPEGQLQGIAKNYWRIVEEQHSKHRWETIGKMTLFISAIDPIDTIEKRRSVLVHPDYRQFAIANMFAVGPLEGSVPITFELRTSYNTGVIVTGFSRYSLKKETNDYETLQYSVDLGDPYNKAWYDVFQFKEIPFEDETAYRLISLRKLYKQYKKIEFGDPFSMEWRDYNDLPDRIKKRVRKTADQLEDGRVGILIPDPNYIEPMLIMTETRRKNSFVWAAHPDNSADNPIAPLIAGEESYYSKERKILEADKYFERETNYSSKNSGFGDVAESVKRRTVTGKPPEASTRKEKWEQRKQKPDKPEQKYRHYITSDWVKYDHLRSPTSVSYPTAKNLKEAMLAAETDLRIQEMQNSQENKTLAFYFPNIRDGEVLTTGRDRFGNLGRWRVMNLSIQLEFAGLNDKGIVFYPNPLALANSGTQITLGLDRARPLKHRKEPIEPSGSGDPSAKVVADGPIRELGIVLPKRNHRRKF